MPPPSTSMRLPSGKTTRRLSPWPTSMAVISSSPGMDVGRERVPQQQRQQRRHGSPRPCATSGRAPMAAAISAAESATPSQTGGVGMRQFGSRPACQPTTFCESHSKHARDLRHPRPAGEDGDESDRHDQRPSAARRRRWPRGPRGPRGGSRPPWAAPGRVCMTAEMTRDLVDEEQQPAGAVTAAMATRAGRRARRAASRPAGASRCGTAPRAAAGGGRGRYRRGRARPRASGPEVARDQRARRRRPGIPPPGT